MATNSIQVVLDRFHNVWGTKYDYSKMIYKRSDEKVEIICKEHGPFWQQPNYHWRGQNGCKRCSYDERNKTTIPLVSILKNFNDVHGDKYDYSKINYENYSKYNKNIEIICRKHGSFFWTPKQHSDGYGCPECKKIEQLGDLIERFKRVHTKYDYSKIQDYNRFDSEVEIICKEHGSFWQLPTNHIKGSGCPKCKDTKLEINFNEDFKCFDLFDRNLIGPLEIDLLNHEHKFGIEINGFLWHSFGKSFPNNLDQLNKNKHLVKTNLMEEKGYQLFHITDIEINNPIKKEIWYSVINSKLGKTNKIYARKTKVVDLTNNRQFVKDYLINNHLQGSCNYKYAYGLEYDGCIYSIMTFGSSRFNKEFEYELLRFCNFRNTTIVGGASKLLKHFERINNPKSLISYAKRDWSQGNLYEKIGFIYSHTSPPNSYWINIKERIFYNRIVFQKHKLKEKFINFNENITANENMFNNDYRIYYDSGNKVYIKNYKGNA